MTLTTHAIVGASIASIMPSHPMLGFTLGFASHFLLDAIPHWDYDLASMVKDENNPLDDDMLINKNFIFDLLKISGDIILGFVLIYFLLGLSQPFLFLIALYAGACGAILPDALQFVYFKWRHEPVISLQKFHIRIQHHLENHHILGRFTQIVTITFFVAISKLFF